MKDLINSDFDKEEYNKKSNKEKLLFIQKRYGGHWRFPEIKDYCFLVNPYFPSEAMQDDMKNNFFDLISQYPSGQKVQNKLAGMMFGIKEEQILVGNGAAEIIRGIGSVINGTFGMIFPTFNEYPESVNYNRIVKFIPSQEGFLYGIDDLKSLADKSDNLILINPDNPSGNFNKKDIMLELLDYMKINKKFLIIDESFIDFAQNGKNETLVNQKILDKYKNLIIIKSIGKSYGVPGIRLGVVVSSNQKILDSFSKEVTIWNINSFGEFFLQIIGNHANDYKEACILIQQERKRFYNDLQQISYLKIFYSEANYFLCKVIDKYSATELSEKLIKKNIFIKDLTDKIGCEKDEYIRLTVRDKVDNDILMNTLLSL